MDRSLRQKPVADPKCVNCIISIFTKLQRIFLALCSFLAAPLSLSPFWWPRPLSPLSACLGSREGLLLAALAGLRPPLSAALSRSGRLLGPADGRLTEGL